MSKRSQQKRNARSKEKAKQLRRERGMSPLSRLVGGPDGDDVECWAHYADADERLVSFLAFRAVRGAGFAVACFLVDFDCIGLKDAFYRLDVPMQETLQGYRERKPPARLLAGLRAGRCPGSPDCGGSGGALDARPQFPGPARLATLPQDSRRRTRCPERRCQSASESRAVDCIMWVAGPMLERAA